MENSRVRSIIKLYENRSKKENAARLNKPLSKSFSSLSNSEWKSRINSYDNHDRLHKIDHELTSYTSRIKRYSSYDRELHIVHQQELLQILIDLVNIHTDTTDAIIAKKKDLVDSVITQFKELNIKLPSTLSKQNFDFTYRPYSSLGHTRNSQGSVKYVNKESPVIEANDSIRGSVEKLGAILRTSQNSLRDYENRKSPDIIVENDNIIGSVEKLRAIFNNSTDEVQTGKLQVKVNYFPKAHIEQNSSTSNFHESVEKETLFNDNQKTNNENGTCTEFPESNETSYETENHTKLDENEVSSFAVESISSLKYIDADTHCKNDLISNQTEVVADREVSDTDDICLSSRNLNEISRIKDGMQNVSSLKKIFEKTSLEDSSEDQNSTEDESFLQESLSNDVEQLEDLEISCSSYGQDENDVISTTICGNGERKEMLNDSDEIKEVTLIENSGNLEEEEANVPFFREDPDDVKSTDDTSPPIFGHVNDPCLIS